MNKVMLDASLRAKFHNGECELELCDESGRTLAHVVPVDLYQQLVYAWANSQVTDEELARASQEPGGRPLAAIWKSLGRT